MVNDDKANEGAKIQVNIGELEQSNISLDFDLKKSDLMMQSVIDM